ncbi:uncharacterized protein [Mytilus edulis]|uniref:uncharacterized protein n=1 Tax=Mytilus edulis TaxID=6550 RepID=UPI0039EF297E
MAFKNTVNLITELERRYLECSICTEVFDEDERIPRLLPCHHPFCSECIKRLGRRKDTIKCPTCNAVHKVKKNGPIDFPKDNTRRDLTSFLQTHSDHNAFKKCSQCGNTVDITFKCQQCNINLCEFCRCQHETENKTHEVLINKSETFREEDDNLDVCQNPHHERAKVKYFCNSSNCQSVLCPSCALDEHRDISKHDLEDIEAAFKQRKSELGNDAKSLRTRILHVESTVQEVRDKTNTLQVEKNEFIKQMDAIYNRGIKDLKNKRQSLLDRYTASFKRKESKLLTRKDNLDSFLLNANECCSLTEQLINRNSMSSFLNVHQTIDSHVKRYLNTPVEDSTCDRKDTEKNVDFDEYLQMFNSNVEILENNQREENLKPLIEPAKGHQQERHEMNSINKFGNQICKTLADVFGYFTQKVKQSVMYMIYSISMVLKTPTKLIQLLRPENPYNTQAHQEQPNERIVGNVQQDVRHVGRFNLRSIGIANYQRSIEWKNYIREHISKYLIDVFAVFWSIVFAYSFFTIVCEMSLLPLALTEHNKLTGLKFNTQVTSQFACRSADNQTVATKPSENMSCGSTRRLYKYAGVFANTSFLPEQESSIEFSIKFKQMSLKAKEYDDLLIFEFGLTNDSISTKLLSPSIFAVSGFSCQNKFGVCLSIGNILLIESKDIFKSETNSYFAEGRFILNYQPSTLTLLFLAKFSQSKTTIELYRIQPFKLRGTLWPVFAAYETNSVSMTIKTNQVGFDRFTLYPNLYISDDNKTMSNKQLRGTYSSDSFATPVIFTRLKNFGTSGTIQTMLNIDFVDLNGGNTLYKFGIGKHEYGVFKETVLLECTKCVWTILFGLYPSSGYCLSVHSDTKQIMVGNHLSLFLHYHRNGSIEMYIVNYYFGYSHRIFQFEQFHNQPPKVYIEKIDAKDIVISSTKKSNIFNMTKVIIALLVIIYFFMI